MRWDGRWEVGGMFPDNEHYCFPPSKHLLQKDFPLPVLSLLWLPALDMLFPVDINVLLEVTPRAALSMLRCKPLDRDTTGLKEEHSCKKYQLEKHQTVHWHTVNLSLAE